MEKSIYWQTLTGKWRKSIGNSKHPHHLPVIFLGYKTKKAGSHDSTRFWVYLIVRVLTLRVLKDIKNFTKKCGEEVNSTPQRIDPSSTDSRSLLTLILMFGCLENRANALLFFQHHLPFKIVVKNRTYPPIDPVPPHGSRVTSDLRIYNIGNYCAKLVFYNNV